MFGFGKNVTHKSQQDHGFKACASCAATHTKTCSKIDVELAEQLGLNPTDLRYREKLADAKKMVLGS